MGEAFGGAFQLGLGSVLGVAGEGDDLVDPELLEAVEHRADVGARLSDHGQVAHRLEAGVGMDAVDEFDRLLVRAAPGAVGHRAEGRVDGLEQLDLLEQVGFACGRLRRPELDRERRARRGVRFLRVARAVMLGEAGGRPQRGGLVGALPREVRVLAPEAAVGGRLLVDAVERGRVAQLGT